MNFKWMLGSLIAVSVVGGCLTVVAAPAQKAEVNAQDIDFQKANKALGWVNPDAMLRALTDRENRFPGKVDASKVRAEIEKIKTDLPSVKERLAKKDPAALSLANEILTFQRKFMIQDNPAVDFDDLLFVRRGENRRGFPNNWESNSSVPKTGYNNDVAKMALRTTGEVSSLYRPEEGAFIGDVELHYDAGRFLFSSIGSNKAWHVFEYQFGADTPIRQITQANEKDINHYDACYLADDRILFNCTALNYAVPCVDGSAPVTNLFRVNPDGSGMVMLTNDQEHNWNPVMLADGRVMYTRWEYADIPHSNSRIVFTMNPDGTNQKAYYGSNSFWPNSFFYSRQIPGKPSQFVSIISGHHGVQRIGEMILFDTNAGTHEADGVVMRFPESSKKVEPLVRDQLVNNSWPKFIHPFPVDEKNFVVAMRPDAQSEMGAYIVDCFDNVALIYAEPGMMMLEPTPLRKSIRPPVIPDRTNPDDKEATIYISDVYAGPGLKDIPRGEIANLRIYTYTFGSRGQGGLYGSIGMDGPWDMRRMIGTVPVCSDGSAMFKVPANIPVAIQPLDRDGNAMQVMRSWFTARNGETLSCIGCHEDAKEVPPHGFRQAARNAPEKIKPWYGPVRNYEFAREVQPVLDRNCVGCHDGSQKDRPDLRGDVMITGWNSRMDGRHNQNVAGKFSVGYANLHRYVRRPGIESDIHLFVPMEYHASTTELMLLLKKNHYGVKLDKESMDRLVTWIDMNAPYHGRWETMTPRTAAPQEALRAVRRAKYAGVVENHEIIDQPLPPKQTFVQPEPVKPIVKVENTASNFPFSVETAQKMQDKKPFTFPLSDTVSIRFVWIPAGEFMMGSECGYADEAPRACVKIDKGFWMGEAEITNAQFRMFNPGHHSRRESRHGYQFGVTGYDANEEDAPAVRLSWKEANAFCQWLAQKSGRAVNLPTEAQWEWAARAGNEGPFWYGGIDSDFAKYANLGDVTLSDFSGNPYVQDRVKARYNNPDNIYDNWIPQVKAVNDGGFITEKSGKWLPNPWGLFDMHGNAAEWTRSVYLPYPYADQDGRNALDAEGERVIRGGSWWDRPKHATASFRRAFKNYQKVYNVGFRVIIEE